MAAPEQTEPSSPESLPLFDLVGGLPFFERLVARFYDGVANDPVLLRLYPDQMDLAPARRRLTLFLAQYWGGPTTYSDERGHPRLRARHFPFEIGSVERDHWLARMHEAYEATVADAPLEPAVAERFLRYLDLAADAMRNRE